MRALTAEEISAIKPKLVRNGVPVRFMHEGCACNIETGAKQPKGINVIYQWHWWNFTREVAKEVAQLTGTKPIFSE